MSKLQQFVSNHPKLVFWSRFVLWLICALGLPIAFIIWKFELFQVVSKLNISGWGILVILLVLIVVFIIVRYVRLILNAKYTFVGQCLNGFCKVILPLLAALLIFYNTRNNIDLLIQVLSAILLCETMAVPLNPFPKLVYDKQKGVREEERRETVDYLLDSFFKRKNGRL